MSNTTALSFSLSFLAIVIALLTINGTLKDFRTVLKQLILTTKEFNRDYLEELKRREERRLAGRQP